MTFINYTPLAALKMQRKSPRGWGGWFFVTHFAWISFIMCANAEKHSSCNVGNNGSKTYTRHERACVSGHNMEKYSGKTVEECSQLCDADSGCRAFEYGVFYGAHYGDGGSSLQAGDCQLQSSANKAGCDGSYYNMDLYIQCGYDYNMDPVEPEPAKPAPAPPPIATQGGTGFASCRCSGVGIGLNASLEKGFPEEYGTSCKAWEDGDCSSHECGKRQTCDAMWPNVTTGTWCCRPWCYIDPSSCTFDDVTASEIMGQKLHYSYNTCDESDTTYTESTCPWAENISFVEAMVMYHEANSGTAIEDFGVSEEVQESTGYIVYALMGTLAAMGGPAIQPVLSIINGFMAAEVGSAFMELLEKSSPHNLLAFLLRTMSGFSIGTVAIQNAQAQSILQGGVMTSVFYASFIRESLDEYINDSTTGLLQHWALAVVDLLVAGLGSGAALMFQTLGKIANSSYLASMMIGDGYFGFIESAMGNYYKWYYKTSLKGLVMLFCLWWHSLILARRKVTEYKRISGKKDIEMDVDKKGLMKKLQKSLTYFFDLLNRLITAFSMILEASLDLKGEPETMKRIVHFACVSNGLKLPSTTFKQWFITRSAKNMVQTFFTEKKNVEQSEGQIEDQKSTETKLTVKWHGPRGTETIRLDKQMLTDQLVRVVCRCLDVEAMSRIQYELTQGSGDFTLIFDELLVDITQALLKSSPLDAVEDDEETEDPSSPAGQKSELLSPRKRAEEGCKSCCGPKKQQESQKISLRRCIKKGLLNTQQLEELWDVAKHFMKKMITDNLKGVAVNLIALYCGIVEEEYINYIEDELVAPLSLDETVTTIKLVQAGWSFSIKDLQTLVKDKKDENQKIRTTKPSGEVKLKKRLKRDQSSWQKMTRKLSSCRKKMICRKRNEVQEYGSPAEAVLAKSHEQAPKRLAQALCEVFSFSEATKHSVTHKVPFSAVHNLVDFVEDIAKNVQAIVVKALKTALTPIPYVGPMLLEILPYCKSTAKTMLLSKMLASIINTKTRQYQGSQKAKVKKKMLKILDEAVSKWASMDEYIDDVLEQMFYSGPEQVEEAIDDDESTASVSIQEELTGMAGYILDEVRFRGPGVAIDHVTKSLTNLFAIDIKQAKNFVNHLNPKDLMELDLKIRTGGFPFDQCTEHAQNTVEQFEFRIPLNQFPEKEGQNMLAENDISFSFASLGVPPTVIQVDEEWLTDVKEETGPQECPQPGDHLLYIGSRNAREMSKDKFEMTLSREVQKSRQAQNDPTKEKREEATPNVKLTFSRGLNIDFARTFRDYLPNALRTLMGVPRVEGTKFARNLDMDEMQEVAYLLENGGLRQFENLAHKNGVEMSFQQSLKADLPDKLSRNFGFNNKGAKVFCKALDPADGLGVNAFWVRIKQMFGYGDLEFMFRVLCKHDVHKLDRLHKVRFRPRVDLCKWITDDMLVPGVRTNLVVRKNEKRKQLVFQMYHEGEPLSSISCRGKQMAYVHKDTVEILLSIWADNIDCHYDQTIQLGLSELRWASSARFSEFSSEESFKALKGIAKKYDPRERDFWKNISNNQDYKAQQPQHYFKWPEFVIQEAKEKGFTDSKGKTCFFHPQDEKIAYNLFFLAIAEARETVWTKYNRKILLLADEKFGAPDKGKDKDKDKDKLAESSLKEKEDAQRHGRRKQLQEMDTEVKDWFTDLLNHIPDPGPKRIAPLMQIEKALKERDAFRLAKIGRKFKMTKEPPMDGLLQQLKATLGQLDARFENNQTPENLDLHKHCNDIADFVTALKNPLHIKPLHDASKSTDKKEDQASAPKKADCAIEIEGGVSAPTQIQPQQPHPAGPLKVKDIFSLVETGDFEVLSNFTASTVEGGSETVADTMRKNLAECLQTNFQISSERAKQAVQLFIPATYRVRPSSKEIKLSTSAQLSGDGSKLAPNQRVSIDEEASKANVKYVVRPQRGWLLSSELEASKSKGPQEDNAMNKVSACLRSVKMYEIEQLQNLSDELEVDIDFFAMSRRRLVNEVMAQSSDYQETLVRRAAKQSSSEDLKACLLALDRSDMPFIIECLKLPPPCEEKEEKENEEDQTNAVPKESPEAAKITALEKTIEEMHAKIEKLEQTNNEWTHLHRSQKSTITELEGTISESMVILGEHTRGEDDSQYEGTHRIRGLISEDEEGEDNTQYEDVEQDEDLEDVTPVLQMSIENMDFEKLDHQAQEDLKYRTQRAIMECISVKEAIAESEGVQEDQIEVELQPGSVKVIASFRSPIGCAYRIDKDKVNESFRIAAMSIAVIKEATDGEPKISVPVVRFKKKRPFFAKMKIHQVKDKLAETKEKWRTQLTKKIAYAEEQVRIEKDKEIEHLMAELQEKDEEIEHLMAELQEKDEEIQQRDERLEIYEGDLRREIEKSKAKENQLTEQMNKSMGDADAKKRQMEEDLKKKEDERRKKDTLLKEYQAQKEREITAQKDLMERKEREITEKTREVEELKTSKIKLKKDLAATEAELKVFQEAEGRDMLQEFKNAKEDLMSRVQQKEVEDLKDGNLKEMGTLQMAMDKEILKLRGKYAREMGLHGNGETGFDAMEGDVVREVEKLENAKKIWIKVMQNAHERALEEVEDANDKDLEELKNKHAQELWMEEMRKVKEKISKDLYKVKRDLKNPNGRPPSPKETEDLLHAEDISHGVSMYMSASKGQPPKETEALHAEDIYDDFPAGLFPQLDSPAAGR